MAASALTSLERFLALPPDETVIRELDEGRILELPPPLMIHSIVVTRLGAVLSAIFGPTSDCWVAEGSGFRVGRETMRIPDVLVIRKSALESMERFHGWYEGAPDLAIEVVSPGNKARDLDRKVQQFLHGGSVAVWIVYPDTRHVVVHRNDGSITNYPAGSEIGEPAVLVSAKVAVDDIFAGLPEDSEL